MAESSPDFSGLLSGLLSNPAALSAITGLLGSIKPSGGECHEEPPPPPCPPAEPPLCLPKPPCPPPKDRRRELLRALRPFLSPARCRTLDGAVKLLEVMELFRQTRGENEYV